MAGGKLFDDTKGNPRSIPPTPLYTHSVMTTNELGEDPVHFRVMGTRHYRCQLVELWVGPSALSPCARPNPGLPAPASKLAGDPVRPRLVCCAPAALDRGNPSLRTPHPPSPPGSRIGVLNSSGDASSVWMWSGVRSGSIRRISTRDLATMEGRSCSMTQTPGRLVSRVKGRSPARTPGFFFNSTTFNGSKVSETQLYFSRIFYLVCFVD